MNTKMMVGCVLLVMVLLGAVAISYIYNSRSRDRLAVRDIISFRMCQACGYVAHAGSKTVMEKLNDCSSASPEPNLDVLKSYDGEYVFLNRDSAAWQRVNEYGNDYAATIFRSGNRWRLFVLSGGNKVTECELNDVWAKKIWGWAILPLNNQEMAKWILDVGAKYRSPDGQMKGG